MLYELTENTCEFRGRTLRQIRASKNLPQFGVAAANSVSLHRQAGGSSTLRLS